MTRQQLQSGRGNCLAGVFIIIVSLAAIYGFVQIASLLFNWLTKQAASADPTVMAAFITGAGTILSSVFIASYNAGRSQERAAEVANRGRKIELYNEFIETFSQLLISLKAGKSIDLEETAEFFASFTYQLMVYGGPGVIKVYGEWRAAGETFPEMTSEMLTLVDKLLRALRDDLGVSNKGIKENELLGLVIIGGKSEIDKALKSK